MKKLFSPGKIFYGCAAAVVLLCMFLNAVAKESPVNKKNTVVHFSKTIEGNIDLFIKTAEEKKVEFYLFRASGELVKKIITTSRQTNTIDKPANGQYLYQCFDKDVQLVSGTLSIANNEINYD